MGLMSLWIDVLATAQDTNNTLPTGGDTSPIDKFNTIIMPNWISDIPSSAATGKNIGVKINTAGVISINAPTKIKIILINNKIIIGLSLSVKKKSLIALSLIHI